MNKGKLFVIEGACDGTGKSTQYDLLSKRLKKDNYSVEEHHFPSYDTYHFFGTKYSNLPYYICGHSMGSYLLRRYICDHSNDLSGVIIIGTGYMSPCETLMSLTFIKILVCFKGTRHKSQMIKK